MTWDKHLGLAHDEEELAAPKSAARAASAPALRTSGAAQPSAVAGPLQGVRGPGPTGERAADAGPTPLAIAPRSS